MGLGLDEVNQQAPGEIGRQKDGEARSLGVRTLIIAVRSRPSPVRKRIS